jgi:hypothetical protein
MSFINPKNINTFAGTIKLNLGNRLISYIALIIPHNKASDDAISKFRTNALAVNAFELLSSVLVTYCSA